MDDAARQKALLLGGHQVRVDESGTLWFTDAEEPAFVATAVPYPGDPFAERAHPSVSQEAER